MVLQTNSSVVQLPQKWRGGSLCSDSLRSCFQQSFTTFPCFPKLTYSLIRLRSRLLIAKYMPYTSSTPMQELWETSKTQTELRCGRPIVRKLESKCVFGKIHVYRPRTTFHKSCPHYVG